MWWWALAFGLVGREREQRVRGEGREIEWKVREVVVRGTTKLAVARATEGGAVR